MTRPEDPITPDTPPESATDVLGASGVELVVSPAEVSPIGVAVAAAGDGLKTDLTLLGLQDLLSLRLEDDGPNGLRSGQPDDSATGRLADLPSSLAQLRETADLPADLTNLDLDQVLGLQVSGDQLPTVLEVARLPADLTSLELAQLLGLEVTGANVPTVQEVIQLAVNAFNNADNENDGLDRDNTDTDTDTAADSIEVADSAEADSDGADQDGSETGVPSSTSSLSPDSDVSVIEGPSLTEHAALNSAAAAKAASHGMANGKPFTTDGELPSNRIGQKDDSDDEDFDSQSDDSNPPPDAPLEEPSPPPSSNTAPVATNDNAGTLVNSAVLVSVLANDSDIDLDTLTITGITQGANGSVVNNGDGTVTYTPNAAYTGPDSFTYTIDDGNGGTDTATVSVTVSSGGVINGTAGDDTLIGNAADETINGLGGNDLLEGAGGADALDGGTGTDTAFYGNSATAVNVSLAAGTGTGGDAQGDTLANIENLTGSDYDDTLTGDGNANVIDGAGGADSIVGGGGADNLLGRGGNDTLEGDAGDDTLDGGGGDDSLLGGDDDDDLSGSGGDDTLEGGAGADTLDGSGGSDWLDGGAGVDDLDGGGGDDTIVWDFNDLNIDGGATGTDTLRVESGNADITTFAGTIDGIDQVDMEADAGANTLTVSYADVLSMTDNTDTLTIDGDAGDSLDAGTGWTDGGVSGGYHTYTQGSGGNTATLQVDTDVSVNANILL